MVNDTDRLLFKSNKHWTEGIRYFVWLIHDMVSNSMEDKELLNALLQHDGLLGSIIQWSFWTDYRPDIVEGVGDAACEFVVKFGKSITRLLVNNMYQGRNGKESLKNWLEKVGSTPVVSKAYDPNARPPNHLSRAILLGTSLVSRLSRVSHLSQRQFTRKLARLSFSLSIITDK